MKKVYGLLLVAVALCMVGCDKKNKYEKAMEDYVTVFYNNHQSGNTTLDNPIISIAELKEAVSQGYDDFDMSKLEKCSDESYTKLIINKDTRKIESYEHHLNCK